MTALCISALVIVTADLFSDWRCTRVVAVRWELFAIRDRLRRLAIDDESVRESAHFRALDHQLTDFADMVIWMTAWHTIAFLVSTATNLRSMPAADERPEWVDGMTIAAGQQILRGMWAQHVVLVTPFYLLGRIILRARKTTLNKAAFRAFRDTPRPRPPRAMVFAA